MELWSQTYDPLNNTILSTLVFRTLRPGDGDNVSQHGVVLESEAPAPTASAVSN